MIRNTPIFPRYLLILLTGLIAGVARGASPASNAGDSKFEPLAIFPVFREGEIIRDPNAGPQYPAYTVKEYRITIHVFLLNQGNTSLTIPTTVPVRGTTSNRLAEDGNRRFSIIYGQYFPKEGGTFANTHSIPIIPSAASLLPVELGPHEFTQITILADVPAEVNPLDIDFIFSVEEALGKRFNMWSGKVGRKLLKDTKELQDDLFAKTK